MLSSSSSSLNFGSKLSVPAGNVSLSCPFPESAVAVLNLRRFDEVGRIGVVYIHRLHRLAMLVVKKNATKHLIAVLVRPFVFGFRAPTLDPIHDNGLPKDCKMHRAGLRLLLQHLHPLRHTNFVRCCPQLCSLWRRFASDLEIFDIGIAPLLLRRVLI